MANYIATTEQFTATANAIRAKTGSSGSLEWDANTGYADDIAAIPTGDDTSDANATAADILSGKTAYVKGYKVTGNIAFQPAQTITPGTTNQTIASRKYLTGIQTIKGDANLVASNIAEGISIFGVTGTHTGGGGDDVLVAFIEGPVTGVFENSKITKIRDYAFYHCISLTTVSFPNCTTIGSYAFDNCNGLTTASFPNCTTIGSNAFIYCRLTTVSFPNCTTIGSNAFNNCSLTTASFPNCTTIGSNAFNNCRRLTTVSFPNCTTIGSYAFTNCSLTTVSFPNCTTIGSYAFSNCNGLTTVILNASQTASSIHPNAFFRCYKLTSLYLLASTMYKLTNINAFTSTPISNYTTSTGGVYGSIFVRSSLYASYKAATNWATYSARFVSLTDAQVAHVIMSGTHT